VYSWTTFDLFFLCRLLLNGAQLIAIHKGKYYQQCDGLSLGPGLFVLCKHKLTLTEFFDEFRVTKTMRYIVLFALLEAGELIHV